VRNQPTFLQLLRYDPHGKGWGRAWWETGIQLGVSGAAAFELTGILATADLRGGD